jgi:hypothetical protein
MSRRTFGNDQYEVSAGWDRPLQFHFLDIYQRDQPDSDPIFSNLYLQHPAMTLEQIADTLNAYGIAAPQTLLHDLRMDAEQNRGDFDEHYDPETGTGSIQAEYGDRPDIGDASAAAPVERNRVQELVDRVREWFHWDQDQGMGL